MKYKTEMQGETLVLYVYHEGVDRGVVYNEFSRCRMGTCSHPTSEYNKVDDFAIEEVVPGELRVTMVPYEGMRFNVVEFSKCFESLIRSAMNRSSGKP